MTEHDPQAHRRMLRTAAAVNAGEEVPLAALPSTALAAFAEGLLVYLMLNCRGSAGQVV